MWFPLVPSVATLFLSAQAVTALTGIIVPLYWEPDLTTCYPEIQQAAANFTDIPFVLIINPNSGPTTDPSDPKLQCIPALRAAIPNLSIIGYVSTSYGNRNHTLVHEDIDTYLSYANYTVGNDTNIPIDGIFIDEVPPDAPGTTNFTTFSGYSDYIRQDSEFGSNAVIVLNPGTKVVEGFYNLGNYVISYESYYDDWTSDSYISNNSTPGDKQGILVHSFPTSGTGANSPYELLQKLIDQVAPSAGMLFITDLQLSETDVYGSIPPDWFTWTALLAARDD